MPDSAFESGLHLYGRGNYVMIGGVLVKKHDKDRRLSEKNEISFIIMGTINV